MKTASRFSAVVALSVSSLSVSQAQSVPPPSPALRAYLRQQILTLVPQLRQGKWSSPAADELALPMAQLGDWNTALRLATLPRTRDALQGWKAEQLALRHSYADAAAAAAPLRERGFRADRYLMIARVAIDHHDLDAARTPLLAAMRTLEKKPDSAQLAYAAWLWNKTGDTQAAQRVLWFKAWPCSLQENESERALDAKWNFGEPDNQWLVVNFAAAMGFTTEILPRISPSSTSQAVAILGGPRNRTDFEMLRTWLQNSKATTPENLITLAGGALALNIKPEANELRDEARRGVEAMPAVPPPPGSHHFTPRMEGLYLLLIYAVRSGDDAEVKRLSAELARTPETGLTADGVRDFSLFFRLIDPDQEFRWQPRYDLTDAQLADITAQVLTLPHSDRRGDLVSPLSKVYARRHDGSFAPQIAAAAVTEIRRQADRYREDTQMKRGGQWSWEVVQTAKSLHEMAPGSEYPVIEALIQQTPPVFRAFGADQLYKAGFPGAARQIFNPSEAFQRDAALTAMVAREHDRNKQTQIANLRFSANWGEVAATEARYEDPAAPEKWFGLIHDNRTRIEVLRGWTDAFYPHPDWKAPYVEVNPTRRNYAVGSTTGSG